MVHVQTQKKEIMIYIQFYIERIEEVSHFLDHDIKRIKYIQRKTIMKVTMMQATTVVRGKGVVYIQTLWDA